MTGWSCASYICERDCFYERERVNGKSMPLRTFTAGQEYRVESSMVSVAVFTNDCGVLHIWNMKDEVGYFRPAYVEATPVLPPPAEHARRMACQSLGLDPSEVMPPQSLGAMMVACAVAGINYAKEQRL